MKLRNKLGALLGAGLLTFAVAGIALADGNLAWDGQQGLTDGQLTTVDCDSSQGAAYIHWVFTPGGGDSVTGATLQLSGSQTDSIAMDQSGNGSWSADSDYSDLGTLVASVDYVGSLGSGNPNLVISHGCAGVTPSDTPVPSGGGAGDTDAPTQPPTDTLGSNSTGPSDGAWLLVVALGVLLASVVVLTPARAKSRR